MPDKKRTLEICVDSEESAIAAQRAGADRVELCSALVDGGLTPSAGLLKATRRKLSIGVFAMIRPRGGDFCYSAAEFEQMREEMEFARTLGADGFVLGILQTNGKVDVKRARALVKQAGKLPVTFHRAFDMTPNLQDALEDVVATGAARILTSGGALSVETGIRVATRIVERAGDRIAIMLGSGIRPENIAEIARVTGAQEFHGSARETYASPMRFRKRSMSLGDIPGREYARYRTSEKKVRALARALAKADSERYAR